MKETSAQTEIHTYHCLCAQLLLASPYALSSLPRRGPPGLDRAIILPLGSPLPSPPSQRKGRPQQLPSATDGQIDASKAVAAEGEEGNKGESHGVRALRAELSAGTDGNGGEAYGQKDEDGDEEDEEDEEDEGNEGDDDEDQAETEGGRLGYSLLMSTTVDRRAMIVRREDGFEKRWVRRCGRCRAGIGYVLASTALAITSAAATVAAGSSEEKRSGEVIYLLEGALVETAELEKVLDTDGQENERDNVTGDGP